MRLNASCIRSVLLICFVLLLFVSLPSQAQTLRLGTITNTPVDEIRTYHHLANYLQTQLASQGIKRVEVKMASSIEQMITYLQQQEIDLYIDSSMVALLVNQKADSQFLLRRWKKGRASYHSVIAVVNGGVVRNLSDLHGQNIAFEEPFSTSGFILPYLSLSVQGIQHAKGQANANALGYQFAYDNESQITWLERGKVQAAAMSGKDFQELTATALKPLWVLHQTPEVPYHVVVHRSGLDPQLINTVKTILMQAEQSEAGRLMLQQFERTTRFDEIPLPLLNNMQPLAQHFSSLPL